MITDKQRIHLMAELWPNAARAQGWDRNDKAARYAVFARVLGHLEPHARRLAGGGRISANDFVSDDRRDDFGAVKKELLAMAGTDLRQEDEVRRRRLWIVRSRLMPCYAMYRPAQVLDKILRERFRRTTGWNTIEDLPPKELENLIFTLEARVNAARKEAGDNHHAMCLKANVERWKPCPKGCALCVAQTVCPAAVREAVAPFADEEDAPF